MPSSECNEWFPNEITESKFCAYDPEFLGDACKGDSGGPLQYFNLGSSMATVVGVVSFGLDKCPSEAPDIYTKVGYYLDWIQSHVWPEETPMKYFDDKNINNFDSGMIQMSVPTTKGSAHKVFFEKILDWSA